MSEEPIDPELGALFAKERANAKAPAGAKARSWAKLEAAIGGPPPPASPPASPPPVSGALPKLLGALAIGALLGGGGVALLRPPQVVYVDRPVPALAASEAPSATTVALPSVVRAPEPTPSVALAAPTTASPSASSSNSSSSLSAERAILDDGRTALGRGDGQHALEATQKHAHDFPHGQLTEEREAIAIQALAKLKRCNEATERGHRFDERYPNSVLGPVVSAALAFCTP